MDAGKTHGSGLNTGIRGKRTHIGGRHRDPGKTRRDFSQFFPLMFLNKSTSLWHTPRQIIKLKLRESHVLLFVNEALVHVISEYLWGNDS